MAAARIIDETGKGGPWISTLKDILNGFGFNLTTQDDSGASLTVLLVPEEQKTEESLFLGDLLVLSIPSGSRMYDRGPSRMEIIGTSRIKVRYTLSDPETIEGLPDEIRSLVKLFV